MEAEVISACYLELDRSIRDRRPLLAVHAEGGARGRQIAVKIRAWDCPTSMVDFPLAVQTAEAGMVEIGSRAVGEAPGRARGRIREDHATARRTAAAVAVGVAESRLRRLHTVVA